MRWAWVVVAAALAACTPTPASVTAARWYAVDTPHVRLETDLPAAVAEQRAQVFDEEVQQARHLYTLLGVAPRPGTPPLRIVLFSDCEASWWVGSGEWGGRSVDFDEPGLVTVCEDRSRWAGSRFRYWVANVLTRDHFGRLPRWLRVGLAEYFAKAYRSGDMIVLPPPPWWVDPDVSLAAVRADRDRVIDHEGPHKAVHAMLNTSEATRGATARFLAALATGVTEHVAWQDTMSDVEAEIARTYRTEEQRDMRAWKVWAEQRVPFDATARAMTRVEVASRIVDLGLPETPRGKFYTSDRRALLHLRRVDPTGDTYLYWRALAAYRTGSPHPGDARELFAAYVKRRPDDLRGHLGLFLVTFEGVTGDEPDVTARLDAFAETAKRIVPVATTPTALEALARFWFLRGDHAIALPFARRAIERDPRCSRCFATLARIRHAQGAVADAVHAQERAITALGDEPVPPAMTDALTAYRAALSTAPPAPVTPSPPPAPPPELAPPALAPPALTPPGTTATTAP